MGSIMSRVPGGLGMDTACTIPGAVNYMYLEVGVMRRAATLMQPAIAANAAFVAPGRETK
jgi:hypothetical protein